MLTPDKFAKNYYDIKPKHIKDMNCKAIFVDLDGTLVSKDEPKSNEKVRMWIKDFKDEKIDIIIVSNNKQERVANFCKDLDIKFIYLAKKPLIFGLKKAFLEISDNIKTQEICMIGDQIFTDTFAAKNFKAKSIYVDPIDKNSLYVKFRTKITEKYFVRKIKENIE